MKSNSGSYIQLKGIDFTFDEMKESRERNGLLRIGVAIGEGGKKRQCNSRCPYCFEEKETIIKKFSLKQINSIVKEAKSLGAKTIVIIGFGEPLIPSRLEETFLAIEIINKSKLIPILFTNGLSMNKEIASKLHELNTSIVTKLNSFNPIVQDYLTRSKNSLERMKGSIKILMDTGFNKTSPTRLGLETPIFFDNSNELPRIAKFCMKNNIYPYFEALKFTGEIRKNPHLYLNREKVRKSLESVMSLYPNIFGTNGIAYIPQGRCCLQHYYGSLFITPNGIFPCSGVNYSLGNIRNTKLREALNSEIIHKLRNLHIHLQGKCKDCKHAKDNNKNAPLCFGGCRGNTFNLTGNLYDEDPLCWRN